jgi:UDP:flavonoid glycosyltransferase YjiC (YdhE family)
MIVCQGIGTASAALVAGRPVLLLPEYLEQLMTLNCLARLGLGIGVARAATADAIRSAARIVIDRPNFRENAERFARRYHGFSPGLPAAAIIGACNKIVGGKPSRTMHTTAVNSNK